MRLEGLKPEYLLYLFNYSKNTTTTKTQGTIQHHKTKEMRQERL